MDNSAEIKKLTYDEYFVLMCLFGAEDLQGTFVEDKYDISPEEFENLWSRCQKTLSDKGYIIMEQDAVNFDIELYVLLNECIKSERKFNVQVSRQKNPSLDITFHQSDQEFICVKNDTDNNQLYVYHHEADEAFKSVSEYVALKGVENKVDESAEVELTQQEYVALMADINMGNSGKVNDLLMSKGLSEDDSNEFISTLKNSDGILMVTEYQQEEAAGHIMMFGESCFWALAAENEESVTFKAVSRDTAEQYLRELFGSSEKGD